MAGKDEITKLACVWVKPTSAGLTSAIALIDNVAMLLQLAEIKDSSDLGATLAVIMSACPASVLIWSSVHVDSLSEACAEIRIAFEQAEGVPSQKAATSLKDFLQPDFAFQAQQYEENAPSAVRALLSGLASAFTFPHRQFAVQDLMATPYMTIDLNAVKALDLFSTKPSSLFQVLNKTNCVLGESMLKRWISQPLRDIRAIQDRQNIVGELMENRNFGWQIGQKLRQVPDLNALFIKFARRASGVKQGVGLGDCVKLYSFVKVLQTVEELMTQYALPSLQMYTTSLQEASIGFKNLLELVEQAIDQSRYSSDLQYYVNPDFSNELKSLRNDIADIESQVETLRLKVHFDLRLRDSVTLKLVSSPTQGYVFETSKTELDNAIRKLTGESEYRIVSHKMQNSSFTLPALVSLSTQKMKKQVEMQHVQDGLVDKVIDFVATYAPLIPKTAEIIGELDVLLSFAAVALGSTAPYVRGEIIPDGDIILYQNRHPGLEKISSSCQANNVIMRKSDSYIQIITGPNMGGKTTYLRQVALTIIMNQIGSYLPCSPGTNQLPVVSSILSRVGANDQSLSGVSTYMAEMMDMASLLRAVGPDSLVIIDELGRGTSTSDGISFSAATIEELALRVKCFALVATHFTELTKLELPGVTFRQAAAEVREGRLNFLYSIEEGRAISSYGIEVAAFMGYGEEDCRDAYAQKEQLEVQFEEEMKEAYRCVGAILDGDTSALEELNSYI